MMTTMRIHEMVPVSTTNGPGCRMAIWVQGCSIRCLGCFNPDTHDFEGGMEVEVDHLVHTAKMYSGEVEGVTLTGGEPLDQRSASTRFLERIRHETSLTSVLITGYRWERVQSMPGIQRLLNVVDVVLAGPYTGWGDAHGLLGGKTFHPITGRYSIDDFNAMPAAEVLVGRAGTIKSTGFAPLY